MSSILPVENLDTAAAAAGKVIMGKLNRQLGQRDISARELSRALIPLYGITWNRAVINLVVKDSINNLFVRLRNSPLPRAEYDRLSTFFKKAYATACSLPPDMVEWRVLAERFRSEMSLGWTVILSAVTSLAGKGIEKPLDLAEVPMSAVFALCEGTPHPQAIAALWSVSRSCLKGGTSADHLIPPHKFLTRESLTKALKRHTRQFQESGKLQVRVRNRVHLPGTFAKMGPAQKIQLLLKSDITPLQADRFVADNLQTNLLKQVRGSLPGVSSSYRCYTAFCEWRKVQPFPPTEELILQWSCVFNDTATYGNYVSLLEKACLFLRFSTSWSTPAVRHVARGLKKCQDRSFRFPNFIRSHLLVRILTHETARSEFAQACFFSFLFSFRVPSETLQLRRAYNTDDLEGFTPQLEKALIGVRTIDGQDFLLVKLTTRKNLTSGCILRRPCFCHLAARKASQLCPVHVMWAAVRHRVDPGQLLFSVDYPT